MNVKVFFVFIGLSGLLLSMYGQQDDSASPIFSQDSIFLNFEFTIEPNGTVSTVKLIDEDMGIKEYKEAGIAAIKKWTFSPSEKRNRVRVKIKFKRKKVS